MAETIRDVVIKIRMQQAGAQKLSAPDVSEYLAAIQSAAQTAQQHLDSVKPGPLGMDPSTLQPGAIPTPSSQTPGSRSPSSESFTAEEREAIRAYARIMAEREKSTKDAEKQYDREANAAVRAYSRIMAERRKAADDAERLAQNTAKYAEGIDPTGGQVLSNRAQRNEQDRQRQSAVELSTAKQQLEAYSAIGEGAIRAARGIAFLTAAKEEDLRVALQYVAAAQGVLDIFAGTASVAKGVITARQAMTAATVAATTAEVGLATAGSAAAGAQAAALIPLAPIALIAGTAAVGIAALAEEYRRFLPEPIKAAESLDVWTEKQRKAADAISEARSVFETEMQQIATLSKIPIGADSLNFDEQRKRITLAAQFARDAVENSNDKGRFGAGVLGRERTNLEQNNTEISKQQSLLETRKLETAELLKQRDIAQGILQTAKQTVENEKNRLASLEERIGRLSKQEQERLKGIAGKTAKGESLTEQEARFLDQTGIGGAVASAFFRKRGQDSGAGEILSGLGENNQLEQAKRDLQSAQATAGLALDDIEEQLTISIQEQTKAYDRIAELVGKAFQLEGLVKRLEAEAANAKSQGVNGSVAKAQP